MKKILSIILSLVLLSISVLPCVYAEEIIDELEGENEFLEDIPHEDNIMDDIIDAGTVEILPEDEPIVTPETTPIPELPAEEHEEEPVAVHEKEIKVLETLGIMENDDYTKSVTRAEFVSIVALMCGYTGDNASVSVHFSDVPSGHEYEGAIAYAAGTNLVHGDGVAFRPDSPITVEEAGIILLRALGHDIASPYITVDIVKARQEGIYDGISDRGNQPLTFDVAAGMIYNAMNQEMILMKGATLDATYPTVHLSKSRTTLLNCYLKMYMTEGVITDNGITAYSGKSQLSSNQVKIDDEVYERGSIDATDLLGHEVEAYYDEDGVLLYVHDITKEDSIVYISAEDIISATMGNVQYFNKSGKVRSISFPLDASIVYNGKALNPGEYTDELLNPQLGGIKFVRTSDKDYDLVVITSEYNCVVESINEYNGIYKFIDMHNSARNVECNSENEGSTLIIHDSEGKVPGCSKISALNILTVAKSLDGEFICIKVSSSYSNGIINKITSGEDAGVVIGDSSYKLAPDVNIADIKLGAFGWYYLDIYGNVAYFRSFDKYEERYGYLTKVSVLSDESDTFRIKVFDESGRMVTASAEKKITVDGQVIKSSAFNTLAENFYSGSDFEPCMIRYKLNLDGTLASIDTYQTIESDMSLHKIEPPKGMDDPNNGIFIGKRRYYINSNRFDGDVFINNDTKVFAIPVGVHEDEDYRMLTIAHFQTNKYYDVELFATDSESYMAEAMIVRYAAKYDPNNTNSKGYVEMPSYYANMMSTGMVTDCEVCLDSNGDVQTLITVYRFDNAKSYSYYIRWEEMKNSFDVGDIIRYYWMDDKIIDAELAFDCNTRTFGTPRPITSTVDTFVIRNNGREAADNVTTLEKTRIVQANWAISYVDALSINSGILTGALTDASNSVDESDIRRVNLPKMSGGVLRYDSRTKLLSVASQEDIVCYKDTNSECSKLAVFFMGGTPRCVLILD